MRVAVTGATGNVGTRLIEALSSDPAVSSIVGIARRRPDRSSPKVTWVSADLASSDLRPLLEGVDAVVHLAWTFQPTHDPLRTWENNVRGAGRLFAAVADAGVGVLVHASSVGAYRASTGDTPVDESWPTDALPTAAYGREKSYLERVLDAFELAHPHIRVVRMRPGFIFQRSSASAQWRLFAGPLVPSSLLGRRYPLVPIPAGLRFQALHSSDAAQAYRLALHEPVHGAFNLAAEPTLTPDELAHALGGRPVGVPLRLARAGVAAAWHARLLPASPHLVDLVAGLPLLDATRARVELGWSPAHSSTYALDELIGGLAEGAGSRTPPLDPQPSAPDDEVTADGS